MAPDMFAGWGLRTLSSDNPAYNPVSYQRGSVWPLDTMIAAAEQSPGLGRSTALQWPHSWKKRQLSAGIVYRDA